MQKLIKIMYIKKGIELICYLLHYNIYYQYNVKIESQI